MSYRKFNADHLFTGRQWLGSDHVLIMDEKGEVQDVISASEAGEDIERLKGILSPGFINCHCHLELSHLKGIIPEKTGMIDFLLGVIRLRDFPMEEITEAIIKAEAEMVANGIMAVGDICNTSHTIETKRHKLLYYHNFIETIGFVKDAAQKRFGLSQPLFQQFGSLYSIPVESNSIVPHAPYTVSEALFELITRFPGNRLLSMHNQESAAENEFFQQGSGDLRRLYEELKIDISGYQPSGKSSLQTVLPYFLKNQSLILVHNCFTNEDDLKFIAGSGLSAHHPSLTTHYFCLCPNANLFIGNPLPDVDLLCRYQSIITIGTDSLASNHQLSVLAELKTLKDHFPHIPIADLLQWATLNGARALEFDTLLGSFEPGKCPGVLVIKADLSAVKRIL